MRNHDQWLAIAVVFGLAAVVLLVLATVDMATLMQSRPTPVPRP